MAQADTFASKKRYNEAIAIYKQLYDKTKDKSLLLRLASCNYLNQNYKPAKDYYASYFKDTVYENTPYFSNYVQSARSVGDVTLTAKLYQKIYENTKDTSARDKYNSFKLYLDSAQYIHSSDLDAEIIPYNKSSASADGRVLVNFASPYYGKQYMFSLFDASNANISNYDILEYIWDMGNNDILLEKKIKYRYNAIGSYTVKLTVIARNKITGNKALYSAHKTIEIGSNYNLNKTFNEALREEE